VICAGDTGDIRRERTVAAVVMVPDQGELHVRPGDPSRSRTATFRIGRP
jgi:isopenicillin-N N-acyltransferase-like protein